MSTPGIAARPLAIDLSQPGAYWHWSIFDISVANLVLIAVMVLIFGAALLLLFPHGRGRRATGGAGLAAAGGAPATGDHAAGLEAGDPEDSRMWTARVRRAAVRALPPGKLLPDRQPAYVASWAYVFGWPPWWRLGWRSCRGSGWLLAVRTGGITTRSGTSSTACTCGVSNCSWR